MALLQTLQVSMSMLNTLLRRCVQVVDARRSEGDPSSAHMTWVPLSRFINNSLLAHNGAIWALHY